RRSCAGPPRRLWPSAPRAATARRRRPPAPGRRRGAGRSRGDVAADERLLDADVWRAFGDRKGELPALAAAPAHLVPGEVAGDVVDPVQGLEQVPGEH